MAFQPPLRNALAVTPSDATIFSPNLQAFYVGGAGTVVLVTPGGHTVTLTAPIVGTVYYIQCKQILAATGATLIIGLW
jgi:hypothetical protein